MKNKIQTAQITFYCPVCEEELEMELDDSCVSKIKCPICSSVLKAGINHEIFVEILEEKDSAELETQQSLIREEAEAFCRRWKL